MLDFINFQVNLLLYDEQWLKKGWKKSAVLGELSKDNIPDLSCVLI